MAVGGVTLFALGEHLDWLSLTLCMIGLIVFTIVFEVFLHNLEHRIRNTAWTKMLSKVYKELMILGFISFVLLMIRQFADLPLTQLLMFELSHVWIFLVAVFFVVHAIIFMLLVRKVKRHWDATAHMEVPELLQKYHATTFWKLPALYYDMFGRGKLREEMGFHIAKSLFLRTHSLPNNFDFAKYLRRSLTQHITDQLDVKESTWTVIIAVMVLNLLRLSATGDLDSDDPWGNVAMGWVILAIDLVLLVASRRSKNRLLMKAGCADMASLPKTLMLTQMAQELKQSGRRVSDQGRRGTLRMLTAAPISAEALDLVDVYPCRKPTIFTKTLEVLMLLQCYSLGLLTLLTGRTLLTEYELGTGVAILIAAALPQLVVMLWASPRILKNHIFVHSITHINKTIVEEVMEIMEITFLLRTEMALVCIAHRVSELDERTAKHLEHAERLFGEIDTNNSGFINSRELKAFLNRVGLHHTPKQFKKLMRSIDKDQTHNLSLTEFSVLVEYGAECVHKYREFLRAFKRDNDRIQLGDVFEYIVQQAGYKVRSGFETFADVVLRDGTPSFKRNSIASIMSVHSWNGDPAPSGPHGGGVGPGFDPRASMNRSQRAASDSGMNALMSSPHLQMRNSRRRPLKSRRTALGMDAVAQPTGGARSSADVRSRQSVPPPPPPDGDDDEKEDPRDANTRDGQGGADENTVGGGSDGQGNGDAEPSANDVGELSRGAQGDDGTGRAADGANGSDGTPPHPQPPPPPPPPQNQARPSSAEAPTADGAVSDRHSSEGAREGGGATTTSTAQALSALATPLKFKMKLVASRSRHALGKQYATLHSPRSAPGSPASLPSPPVALGGVPLSISMQSLGSQRARRTASKRQLQGASEASSAGGPGSPPSTAQRDGAQPAVVAVAAGPSSPTAPSVGDGVGSAGARSDRGIESAASGATHADGANRSER